MTGLPCFASGSENFSRKPRSGSSRSSCRAKSSLAEKRIVINEQQTSNAQRPTSNAEFLPSCTANLHELDGGAVRVAHVNDALTRIRPCFECLRFAGCLPA